MDAILSKLIKEAIKLIPNKEEIIQQGREANDMRDNPYKYCKTDNGQWAFINKRRFNRMIEQQKRVLWLQGFYEVQAQKALEEIMKNRKCLCCGKQLLIGENLTLWKTKKASYCSVACRNKYNYRLRAEKKRRDNNVVCLNCGKPLLAGVNGWKNTPSKYCDATCRKAYYGK